jgi:hypothetical protein
MMMQEENDLTQEMRALVIAEATLMTNDKLDRIVKKILSERPEISPTAQEYTEGLVDGLEWAVRIIRGDKSAS